MKTTLNLVQDLMVAMNARERSLNSPDVKLQENLCAWMGAMVAAKLHACSGPERALLDKIVAAMDLQDKRESGEFHLLTEAAELIWNTAKRAAQAYVIDESARRFGYQGLGVPSEKYPLAGMYRGPHIAVNADKQANLCQEILVEPAPDVELCSLPFPVTDSGSHEGLPDAAYATASPALGTRSTPPAPAGEGYLKQRAEALAKALRRFGLNIKHGQALTVVAQLEGHSSFQSLKATVPQFSPCFCPHCGAAATLKSVSSVYCEQGEYDGKQYEAEGEGEQYQCDRCKGQFNDWTGLAVTDSLSETGSGVQNGFSQDNPDFPNPYQGFEVLVFMTAEELQGHSGVVYERRRDVEDAKAEARERLIKDTCFAVRVRDSRTGEDIKF